LAPSAEDFTLTLADEPEAPVVLIRWNRAFLINNGVTESDGVEFVVSVNNEQNSGPRLNLFDAFDASISAFDFATRGSNLVPGNEYNAIVSLRLNEEYAGRYEVGIHTQKIRAAYLGKLAPPEMTRATHERERRRLNFSFLIDENASTYLVRLYRSESNVDQSAWPLINSLTYTPMVGQTTHEVVYNTPPTNKHYAVGLTARSGNALAPSDEVRVVGRPPTLLESSFNYEAGIDTLSLSWNSDESSDSDFYDKTAHANLLLSVEDATGAELREPREINVTDNAYRIDGLEEGTNYVLKIALRVTLDGTSVDGDALPISFAITQVPSPTREQIRWTADQNTITVHWSSAPEGVTQYDLNLADAPTNPNRLITVSEANSATFSGLSPGTTYTLSVASSTDSNLHVPNSPLLVEIVTDMGGQLMRPAVLLSLASSLSITASWTTIDSVTAYTANLYLGDGVQERIVGPIELGESEREYTFNEGLSLGTSYTVSVSAQAAGFETSFAGVNTIATEFVLSPPTSASITLLEGAGAVVVNWTESEAPAEAQVYLISILDGASQEVAQDNIEVSVNKYVYTDLLSDTSYVLSIVSNNDGAGYVKSQAYTVPFRTRPFPQLGKVEIDALEPEEDSLSLSWLALQNATSYTVSLYQGSDTSAMPLQSETLSRMTNHTFGSLNFGTTYTASVQAFAERYRRSEITTQTKTTLKRQLSPPTSRNLTFTAGVDAITVTTRVPPSSEVENYLVEITPSIGATPPLIANEIANIIGDSLGSITPDTLYTLTFTSNTSDDRYIKSVPYTTIIRTLNRGQLSATTQTALTQNRRGDIRVDWENIDNAQTYLIRLYEGANNTDETAASVTDALVFSPQVTNIFSGLDASIHHTVGIVIS
ncbi:MAG: fibronectin type III domain-containing protein, partial [Candidatus Oxydemutatoraceae bacterium WSBS_2016_MAG_OTU14]